MRELLKPPLDADRVGADDGRVLLERGSQRPRKS
jgi:hypothetical protein